MSRSRTSVIAINHRVRIQPGLMKKAILISLLMVLCPLSGCTDMSPGSTDSENEGTGTSSEEEPEVADEEPEVAEEEPEVAEEEPPEDESPPQNEFDWSTDSFVPQRVGECDSSEIGEIAVQQLSLIHI